jgi:predicted Fe-Mo cluster-binding NifX family protein
MIAIPVKMNKQDTAVSNLFGKSKYFAFIDGDNISIEKNETESGRAVVEDFSARGVTEVVFQHMGGNPFMLLQKAKIECYNCGEDRVMLDDVIKMYKNKTLTKVDGTNMADFVEKGKNHSEGHEHHHDHNHEHNHTH